MTHNYLLLSSKLLLLFCLKFWSSSTEIQILPFRKFHIRRFGETFAVDCRLLFFAIHTHTQQRLTCSAFALYPIENNFMILLPILFCDVFSKAGH